MRAIFVSDIHGSKDHYDKLFRITESESPDALFFGGDLLPNFYASDTGEFINGFFEPSLVKLKSALGKAYPMIVLILGNDDPRATEHYFIDLEEKGLIFYANEKKTEYAGLSLFGYSYVPPTPFLLKDWEKYDISRYVPHDSVSPEEGIRTFDVAPNLVKYITISDDLKKLTEDEESLRNSIFLFHSPPCDTALDLIDGKDINGKPVLKHIGSIAIRKFIEKRQPLVTMHGHIHESSELSGSWCEKIGSTYCFSGACEGSRLAVVRFDTEHLEDSTRELI